MNTVNPIPQDGVDLFKTIPSDLLEHHLIPIFSINSVLALVRTAKYVNELLSNYLLKLKAKKMLTHIIHDRYETIQNNVHSDPKALDALFIPVTFKNGNSMHPIQYVLHIYDAEGLKILFNAILKSTKKESLLPHLKEFLLLKDKHPKHLNSLIEAYKFFISLWNKGGATYRFMSKKQLDSALLKIGIAQKEHLPDYLLKQFCSLQISDDGLKKMNPTFSKLPEKIHILDCPTPSKRTAKTIERNQLGKSFTLFKTTSEVLALNHTNQVQIEYGEVAQKNITTILKLFDKNKEQFKKTKATILENETPAFFELSKVDARISEKKIYR